MDIGTNMRSLFSPRASVETHAGANVRQAFASLECLHASWKDLFESGGGTQENGNSPPGRLPRRPAVIEMSHPLEPFLFPSRGNFVIFFSLSPGQSTTFRLQNRQNIERRPDIDDGSTS